MTRWLEIGFEFLGELPGRTCGWVRPGEGRSGGWVRLGTALASGFRRSRRLGWLRVVSLAGMLGLFFSYRLLPRNEPIPEASPDDNVFPGKNLEQDSLVPTVLRGNERNPSFGGSASSAVKVRAGRLPKGGR
jgi:hypothetical protein